MRSVLQVAKSSMKTVTLLGLTVKVTFLFILTYQFGCFCCCFVVAVLLLLPFSPALVFSHRKRVLSAINFSHVFRLCKKVKIAFKKNKIKDEQEEEPCAGQGKLTTI